MGRTNAGITISQLREYLAELQDVEGDIEVRFAANVDADNDENDSVGVEGVTVFQDSDGQPLYALICDVYTLDNVS